MVREAAEAPWNTAILREAHNADSHEHNPHLELLMVLCPIAMSVGCRKCPIFRICPVKSVIGDYKPDDATAKTARQGKAKGNSSNQR
jgi:hypothetical protein